MKLNDKIVVVTGGAQGIGAALCRRFAAEGARIVVADLDAAKAQEVATEVSGLSQHCDVTSEEDIQNLFAFTEAQLEPIDMFCSNAGICPGEPDHAASAANETWQRRWDIHVMAHVVAARAVLPGMIARGDGYLLQMASAAGLLSQIGDAAYSATKHAALGFAESLSITHGRDGIKVSVICPQYAATPMLGYSGDSPVSELENVISPEKLALSVVKGVEEETFLILPHAEVADYVKFKTGNYDRWLAGMQKLRGSIIDQVGTTDLSAMHKLV